MPLCPCVFMRNSGMFVCLLPVCLSFSQILSTQHRLFDSNFWLEIIRKKMEPLKDIEFPAS